MDGFPTVSPGEMISTCHQVVKGRSHQTHDHRDMETSNKSSEPLRSVTPFRLSSCGSSPLFARFGTLGLFPFSYVKGKLMGYRTETPSELLVRIRVILAEIPRETLNAVFLEWMDGAIAKMRAGRW
jgi:hypothetical protein